MRKPRIIWAVEAYVSAGTWRPCDIQGDGFWRPCTFWRKRDAEFERREWSNRSNGAKYRVVKYQRAGQ